MKKIQMIGAASALALVAVVGGAGAASATAQYGCSTLSGHLHATATLYNYSGKGTAVGLSATSYYKQVIAYAPDKIWTFQKMTLRGYSTKTTNPSLWGWSGAPLNYSTKYADVTWIGKTTSADWIPTDAVYRTCTVKVGA